MLWSLAFRGVALVQIVALSSLCEDITDTVEAPRAKRLENVLEAAPPPAPAQLPPPPPPTPSGRDALRLSALGPALEPGVPWLRVIWTHFSSACDASAKRPSSRKARTELASPSRATAVS